MTTYTLEIGPLLYLLGQTGMFLLGARILVSLISGALVARATSQQLRKMGPR